MSTPQQTVWPIEPHSVAKHELLRNYLDAWFPILASKERRVIFLDGFAGPGIYSDGQPGSPIIALKSLLERTDLDRYARCQFIFHFIEKDPARHGRLRVELQQFDPLPRNVTVATHLDEFQDVIEKVSDSLSSRNRKIAPTLAFIDPFGVSGVPMKLISRFLDSHKCELFLILMVDHLNRFLSTEHMKGGRDSLFGTNDFSAIEAAAVGERIPMLVDLYRQQLRDVAKFQYTQGFEMRRANETVAYYVVYATRHITGVEKFKDAMWKVDPSTGVSFSDRNWNQGSLLTGPNVELSELRQWLSRDFGGESVPVERLDEFTILETPFRKTHLRKVLRSMKSHGRIDVTKPAGSPGEFPEGTQIHFQAGLGI